MLVGEGGGGVEGMGLSPMPQEPPEFSGLCEGLGGNRFMFWSPFVIWQ